MSLVEVMVGVLILGLVFGGGFSVIGQGLDVISNARDVTRASQILQSEMENCRAMGWANVTVLGQTSEFSPTSEFGGSIIERYTCNRNITTRKTDQKQIILTVSWNDSRGISHSRSYLTFYTKGGLNDFYYRAF